MPNAGRQALLDQQIRAGLDQGQVSFRRWRGGISIETLDAWVHILLIFTETGAT